MVYGYSEMPVFVATVAYMSVAGIVAGIVNKSSRDAGRASACATLLSFDYVLNLSCVKTLFNSRRFNSLGVFWGRSPGYSAVYQRSSTTLHAA